MSILSKLLALVSQRNPQVHSEGAEGAARLSRLGQLFTVNWKQNLLLAGRCFGVHSGTLSAGADVALITGGGAGTVIDSDQPELAVGIPAGYYMIPLEFHASLQVDVDLDAEVANVLLFADRTAQIPAPVIASSVLFTPYNLLDGGPESIARAQGTVSTDITDPVMDELLMFETLREADVTAAGSVIAKLSAHYEPQIPSILKGPCSVIGCWGGTAAAAAMARFVWAEIPANWVE